MRAMTTAVLIGLKRLDEAKTRLSPELTADGRRALMRSMLERVVAAACEAEIGPVTLVSSDPGAVDLATDLGIGHQDRRRAGLEQRPGARAGRTHTRA